MTASLLSSVQRAARCALALALSAPLAMACTHAARDAEVGAPLVTVTGDFLADGSCRVTVNGAALFTPADRQHSSYDAGAIADVGPPGFTMHQLACTPADAEPGVPDRAGDRLVLVTLYVHDGEAFRAGRYTVRAGLAGAGPAGGSDTTGAATRAGIAIFGAPATAGVHAGGASGAGVRYLEGRDGTLTITSADTAHVVGSFSVRAGSAWSM